MCRKVSSLVVCALLCLCSCAAPQVGETCPDPASCATETSNAWFASGPRKIDVLFVIDNSPSMTPKQLALADNITRFIDIIDGSGADYHVAVGTSDTGQCARLSGLPGEDGVLQTTPCSLRGFSPGSEADRACQKLCPEPRFVPAAGQHYIARSADGVTNVPSAVVDGHDEGPRRAFQCIALVGDSGCGLEAQLEGARRALARAGQKGDANDGFLRPDSTLALIFITDEDDCSAQTGAVDELAAGGMCCPLGMKDAPPGCFNQDFRCVASSVVCDEPLSSPGEKRNCREQPSRLLAAVKTYTNYFKSLRSANQILVSGIWTLPDLAHGGKLVVEAPGPDDNPDPHPECTLPLNRGRRHDAACAYAGDDRIFGQAQVRLSAFAAGIPGSIQVSVCDIDRYAQALNEVAKQIVSRPACSDRPPRRDRTTGQPICLVGDVDAAMPNASPVKGFPVCSARCCAAWAGAAQPSADDPAIRAACGDDPTCYCVDDHNQAVCAGKSLVGIWRRGTPPVGKVINMKCAVE